MKLWLSYNTGKKLILSTNDKKLSQQLFNIYLPINLNSNEFEFDKQMSNVRNISFFNFFHKKIKVFLLKHELHHHTLTYIN